MKLDKKHTCCFTGHRPDKLALSYDKVKNLLKNEIKQAISEGYTHFISGMSMGVDVWAAELVIEEKEMGEKIYLTCAVPHPDFEFQCTMAVLL